MKDKTIDMILKQMSNNPSVIRTNYAYALLIEKDEAEANRYMNIFDKVKKTYPVQTDIDTELELIEIVKNKSKKKDQ